MKMNSGSSMLSHARPVFWKYVLEASVHVYVIFAESIDCEVNSRGNPKDRSGYPRLAGHQVTASDAEL